jgi:hypothetical protein
MNWFPKKDRERVRDLEDLLYQGRLRHIFGEMVRKG